LVVVKTANHSLTAKLLPFLRSGDGVIISKQAPLAVENFGGLHYGEISLQRVLKIPLSHGFPIA